MTPRRGNTILFCSSQQRLGPLKGFFCDPLYYPLILFAYCTGVYFDAETGTFKRKVPPPSYDVPSAPNVYTFHKSKPPLVDKFGNYFSPQQNPSATPTQPPAPPSIQPYRGDYGYFDDKSSFQNAPGGKVRIFLTCYAHLVSGGCKGGL